MSRETLFVRYDGDENPLYVPGAIDSEAGPLVPVTELLLTREEAVKDEWVRRTIANAEGKRWVDMLRNQILRTGQTW